MVLGKIASIVDQLGKVKILFNTKYSNPNKFLSVVIDSLPGLVPVDIDSVVFMDKGTKPLGQIFDVLGNISSPMYCVRFNSNQQIQEKGVTVGTLVYVAPRTEHTSFVAVSELMKQRGCDASWKNDIEPINTKDFSDDEEERKARKTRRGRKKSLNEGESITSPTTTQNFNSQRNTHNAHPRWRGRGRPSNNPRGNYFGPRSYDSWHNNLQPTSNWNPPMRTGSSPFPPSLLLPPPPPPPPYNSRY